MRNILAIIVLLGLVNQACKEEPIGQQPVDGTAPGPVTNVTVENTAGGAILTYTLPEDEDLLYVKAVYTRAEGIIKESKASLYSDSLVIEGFGDTSEREVKVIAVDRSNNESPAVSVKVNPLTPGIIDIAKSIILTPDFGGFGATWENANNQEIAIVFLKEDSLNNEYIPLETLYSKSLFGKSAVRGLDTIPQYLKFYVQDKWNNRSEIKLDTILPIYETQFDPLNFKPIILPGEYEGVWGWVHTNMWNNIWGVDEGYSSPAGKDMPQSVTVDLGVLGRLSRFKLYQRTGDYTFAEGNPRKFKIYGAETLPSGGTFDNWTFLGDFESIKPSGLPMGQNSNDDLNVAYNGEEFPFDTSNPKVRFIRIQVLQTWAGGDNFQITEFQVFGDFR